MGSFNGKCVASGLNIQCGDEVRLIVLAENPYYKNAEGTIYPGDMFTPIMLPIKDTYNDYGSIEYHSTTEALKCDQQWYTANKNLFDYTNQSRHNLNNNGIVNTIGEFVESITDGNGAHIINNGAYNSGKKPIRGLTYTLVLESMFQALIETAYSGRDLTTRKMNSAAIMRQDSIDDLDRWFNFILSKKDTIANDRNYWGREPWYDHNVEIERPIKTEYSWRKCNQTIEAYARFSFELLDSKIFAKYGEYIQAKVQCNEWQSVDNEDWINLRNDLVDFYLFSGAMMHFFKTYIPFQYSGQETDRATEIAFVKAQLEHLNKEQEIWSNDPATYSDEDED